jgi:hypothetical protein
LVADSLEGFLHVDGKFFRTVRFLFTRPGFLTKEFNAGRRVAYTQPFRLYIFASLLYFTASLFIKQPPTQAATAPPKADAAHIQEQQPRTNADFASKPDPKAQSATPSAFGGLFDRLKHNDPKAVTRELRHLFPTMGFFCLPFLAALLLLSYPRSGRVYVEHFVFAVHLQAFYFLAALLTDIAYAVAGLIYAPLSALVSFLFFFAGAWLLYRAFRNVYAQGRWRTIFKMFFIAVVYGIILFSGLMVSAFAAVLLAGN